MEKYAGAEQDEGDFECILRSNNVLIVFSPSSFEDDEQKDSFDSLAKDFFGTVIRLEDDDDDDDDDDDAANDDDSDRPGSSRFPHKSVYLCGDIGKLVANGSLRRELQEAAERVVIVQELAHGHHDKDLEDWPTVSLGRVPLNIHGVGVYYRKFFDDPHVDYFDSICREHAFQSLTESNKPATAHRTGVYLTPVEPLPPPPPPLAKPETKSQDDSQNHSLQFRLLRCSTNLSGPTENFGATDRQIVRALNQEAPLVFQDAAPLNHVLAQVYWNTSANNNNDKDNDNDNAAPKKEIKARIKAHSDKTKDMPRNAVMAFCTFYKDLHKSKRNPHNVFDYAHKGVTALTKLDFRLKADCGNSSLTPHFSIILYPNSVFFMPLSTNRLYTHEIRPSALNVEKLPTRIGYVVRCSSTIAIHENGQTFLQMKKEKKKQDIGNGGAESVVATKEGGLNRNHNAKEWRPMEEPTPEGMAALRHLYEKENFTSEMVHYGNKFLFSMNQGDYSAPHYQMADEFCQYQLPPPPPPPRQDGSNNIFDELLESTLWETVGKGRRGAVVVQPSQCQRFIPIVRTTTAYHSPAQCFRPVHQRLARAICQRASLKHGSLNNALVEHYTRAYSTMGFHSDQALDLEDDDSYIAVYSCYKYPQQGGIRKLVVESKISSGGEYSPPLEIPLHHNSVVIFSRHANQRCRHKIVPLHSHATNNDDNNDDNEWLGVTFRTSKTWVQFANDKNHAASPAAAPQFPDGTPLELVQNDNDPRRREFYALRRQENQQVDFAYPPLFFTISESDLMPPIP